LLGQGFSENKTELNSNLEVTGGPKRESLGGRVGGKKLSLSPGRGKRWGRESDGGGVGRGLEGMCLVWCLVW